MIGSLLVICATLLGAVTRSTHTCSDGWLSYGGSCYSYGKTKVSFGEAVAICLATGAKLAEPETAAENEFLKGIARDRKTNVWIGGTDILHEGHWVFQSTRQSFADLPYNDWKEKEPNNVGGSEDCLCYYTSHSYQWNDLPCTNGENFICEADGGAVVTPIEC